MLVCSKHAEKHRYGEPAHLGDCDICRMESLENQVEQMHLWIFFREIANAARLKDCAMKCIADPTHCGLPAWVEYKYLPTWFLRDVW